MMPDFVQWICDTWMNPAGGVNCTVVISCKLYVHLKMYCFSEQVLDFKL